MTTETLNFETANGATTAFVAMKLCKIRFTPETINLQDESDARF